MSFQIKIRGRIGASLQTRLEKEIDRMFDNLNSLASDSIGAATHQARKRVKKLRALLALLREPLGKKGYVKADDLLRQVGRGLSGVRDAQAMLKTFREFQRRFFPEKAPALLRGMHEWLVAEEEACAARFFESGAVAGSKAELASLRESVSTWPVKDYGWPDLRESLRRSYRQTRESFHKAQGSRGDNSLHRWRKRVKEFGYHIRLIRSVSPALMDELTQDFVVLGEFLGKDHDLVVLRAAIDERREELGHDVALETVLELIDLRREELLDAAFDLGSRLHEESPGDFIRALEDQRNSQLHHRRRAKKLTAQVFDSE